MPAPDRESEVVVLHSADVKKARPLVRIKLYDVVGAAIPEGRTTAKCARTDDPDLPVFSVLKPCIEELWPVLVAVKAQAEPAIDQVLDKIRVHII